MASIMHWLVPKEEKFFEMFKEQSVNALEAVKELKGFVGSYSNFERNERKSKAQIIKSFEHKGDEIAYKIIEKLNNTSMSPIKKEDMHHLAVLLDDIPDLINSVSLRFVLFGVERIDSHIIKLVDIANSCVGELNKCLIDLKRLKHMGEYYSKIHSLENEADDIYHEALSELFHFYKNSIDIIKYKEIYELLEKIADKCKEITHAIESIAVKNI
ncbi:MAG: DUF47 family protein [Nanoarchaeota archaeon]